MSTAADFGWDYPPGCSGPPEPDPYSCVVCGDSGFDSGGTPYMTDEGEVVCSWVCHAVDRARHAEGVEATLRAVIYAMDEGAAVRVRARAEGGNWTYTGPVIDWCRDGERITIESDRSGRDIDLRRERLRELVVL